MSRRVKLKQAAEITGLSEFELRQGCINRKYPHMRVGNSRTGKIIFDLDLLEERIQEIMLENVSDEIEEEQGRIRRVL